MSNDIHRPQLRVEVRAWTAADAVTLAGLRWRGLTEEGGYTGDGTTGHVRVHSSERAVPLYQRMGFRSGRAWLSWQPE
ncbi:hypothetical protein ABZS77_15610 [Micromonospora sp. NPDC005298]|uniref:hypothetical protein n=1 Tax=Micromonospora sp. NPDC005298 TaxID=3156873 RepID=UPI0033BD5D4C